MAQVRSKRGGNWVFRTLKLGTKSLMLHKLRSFLTMLGTLFGVSSVISMLAVGEGARRSRWRFAWSRRWSRSRPWARRT